MCIGFTHTFSYIGSNRKILIYVGVALLETFFFLFDIVQPLISFLIAAKLSESATLQIQLLFYFDLLSLSVTNSNYFT